MKIDPEKLKQWLIDEIGMCKADRRVQNEAHNYAGCIQMSSQIDAFESLIEIIDEPTRNSADWWCE